MYVFLCVLQLLCPNRMKTYGAITEIMNNITPTNHMKKVAKNNVFVFEDITAPQFFFSDYSEDKTAARKKIFAFRPMTMETRCFHKKLEFPKIPAKRFLYRSL